MKKRARRKAGFGGFGEGLQGDKLTDGEAGVNGREDDWGLGGEGFGSALGLEGFAVPAVLLLGLAVGEVLGLQLLGEGPKLGHAHGTQVHVARAEAIDFLVLVGDLANEGVVLEGFDGGYAVLGPKLGFVHGVASPAVGGVFGHPCEGAGLDGVKVGLEGSEVNGRIHCEQPSNGGGICQIFSVATGHLEPPGKKFL